MAENNQFMDNMPSLLSGVAYGYQAIKEWNAPDIDYDILNLKAEDREIRAQELKMQVEQDANSLRQQFAQAVGTYQHGAATRNVKVGEGSAGDNVEKSAKEVGTDIQKMRGNAEFKADQLRSEAERIRTAATNAKEINSWERTAKTFGSLGKMVGAFRATNWDDGTTAEELAKKKKAKLGLTNLSFTNM